MLRRNHKFDEVNLDYSDIRPRNFEKYYLTRNPFPAIAVTEEIPKIFVDRESLMKTVANVTRDAYTTRKSHSIVIEGSYGNGKSHTLKYIKYKINSQLSGQPIGQRAIAAYLQSPGGSLVDLYSTIVEDLGADFLKKIAISLLSLRLGSGELVKYTSDAQVKKRIESLAPRIKEQPELIESVLTSATFQTIEMFRAAIDSLHNDVRFPDFLMALFYLVAQDERSIIAWRWLLAEHLSKDERHSVSVEQQIEDSNSALRAFQALRTCLKLAGYVVLYMLQDEFEKISELHPLRTSRYYDDLRHLIDQNLEGICLISCVTPTGWAEMYAGGHPLVRRLMGNVAWLDPFDEDQTRRLIEAYIGSAREEFFAKNEQLRNTLLKELKTHYKAFGADLFPFNKESVHAIYEGTRGNISDILTACGTLLNEGADRKFVVFDNSKKVKEIVHFTTATRSPEAKA
jgi:hypothetical protein